MTATEYADQIISSGKCPGCANPFSQISVEEEHHDFEDGSAVRDGDWLTKGRRCDWSSSDLFSCQLLSARIAVER